jgi:hypothetical protein
MSFPSKAPSSLPPGLKLGVFAGGGPFPRLVAPGIVVDDPAHLSAIPSAGAGVGAIRATPSSSPSSSYALLGLTHVLMRASRAAELRLHLPQELTNVSGRDSNHWQQQQQLQQLLIGEDQTLREVVELLVHVRVACPHGRILIFGEPFVAAAYLMAIEGRDLGGTWRLVTGDPEGLSSHEVFKEVHCVLGKFARDVEEEGKKLVREEKKRGLQLEEHPSQPRRKNKRKNV